MGVWGKFIDSGLVCASSSSQSQQPPSNLQTEVISELLEDGEFRWGWVGVGVCVRARGRVSVSGHHPLHSSLPLAALALCRCCWAELWFEGLGSPSKLQIYFQRSRWSLCLWTKKGVLSRSPVTEPLFSCIPAGHLLDRGWGVVVVGCWWGLAAHTPHSFHGKEGIEDPFSGPLVELVGFGVSPSEFKSRQEHL